jgi:ferredoxin
MSSKVLKRSRVAIALVFLLLISLFFIDFRHFLPEWLINSTLYLQFVPSLLKFITLLSASVLGFIVILILTLLFGRIYCSAICPLGIFQDVITRIGNRFKKKRRRRHHYSGPHNWIRYSILVVVTLVFVFGSVLLVNLLDPYSNFGRIFTYLFKPGVVIINNGLSEGLELVKVYSVYKVSLVPVKWELLVYPVLILAILIWFSVKWGRLYCNTICPVGTLLGLLSMVSFFKIRIDEGTCTKCGLCDRACKSECMEIKSGFVDHSRCVACFNCLTVCPESSVKYDTAIRWFRPLKKTVTNTGTIPGRREAVQTTDLGKRRFLAGTVAYLLGMMGISFGQDIPVPEKESTVPEEKNSPVCPPGAVSIGAFNDVCTACTLCVSICPTQVLQPSFLEYGLQGIMQPRMDYHSGFCNFECVKCSEVCPTGAILPIVLEKKKLTQLGKAQFVKENCIVHTERTDCGACSEHCPTKAVFMVPYDEDPRLFIPEVNNDICIGCGACEYPCPTKPYKAIYVDGNPVHLEAEKPEVEETEDTKLEEFPF